MATNSRYDGKPLLRLLELYVLKAIGELSQTEQDALEAMTPKLQAIYGGKGEWYEVIASAIHMPPEMPAVIQNTWANNVEIAQTKELALTPQNFAEMFVDQNFAA
jgi:hypothetical protein